MIKVSSLPVEAKNSLSTHFLKEDYIGIQVSNYPLKAYINNSKYSERVFTVQAVPYCCGIYTIFDINTAIHPFIVEKVVKEQVSAGFDRTYHVFLVEPTQSNYFKLFLKNGFHICSSFQNEVHPDGRTIYQLIRQYKDTTPGKNIHRINKGKIGIAPKFIKRSDIL